LGGKIGLALHAAKIYPDAKKALLAQGWKPDMLEHLPVTQAALMFEIHNYDRIYDDMIKWYGVPYPQARVGMDQALMVLKHPQSDASVGTTLARLLLPAVEKVMFSGARLDRRIAALRCIEALRLHAAEKEAWPEKLDEVKVVPIPLDPVTGKPFGYRAEGDRFTLTAPPPGN